MNLTSDNISNVLSDKNKSNPSNISIGYEFKKLKIANKLAITKSKKEKILNNAEDLSSKIDTKIKSIALSKFVLRKVKKLKDLGKTKEEIDSFISELAASEEDILTRSKVALKGIGIDTKFIGMSAEEILKKINAINEPKEVKTEEPLDTEESVKPAQKSIESPLKVKVNSDTDTIQDVQENNERIYDYLVKTGELDIANYVLDLMTKPDESNIKKTSDNKHVEEIKRLSMINAGISEKLDELEKSLNKQDTSISIPQKLQNVIETNKSTEEDMTKKSSGFFASILRLLLGEDIANMLMNSGGIVPLAIKLLSAGMEWLKTKLGAIFKGMFDLAIKPFSGILSGVKSVLSGLIPAKLTSKLNIIPSKDIGKKPEKISENTMKRNIEKSKPGKGTKTPKALSKVKYKPGILRKLLKFTKPVPFIGTAIAAGTAIYSAQDGYNHADEILGKPKNMLTETDKLASAAGALVNDVTFGILGATSTAQKILEWSGELQESFNETFDIPAKKFNDVTTDLQVDDENKSLKSKIEVIQENVDFLKEEQVKANKSGNDEKVKTLQKNIDKQQEIINKLVNEIADSRYGPDKTIVSKDKKFQVTENAYTNAIDNTKSYDAKTSSFFIQQQQKPSINTINNVGQNKAPSSFELFENF